MPDDETERLKDLAQLQLLDTDGDPAYDAITQSLARLFDVPIALMSLVDSERQWWKSHVGLPDELALARCTSRELSVCGHLVALNEVMVVEDLQKDERFADNPMLRKAGIRFYAGAPLRSESGRAIGSLCILDVRPRKLTDREKGLLLLVADQVMKIANAKRIVAIDPQVGEFDDRAREVHRHLMAPPTTRTGNLRVHGLYLLDRELTGHFCDASLDAMGRMALVVGEAAGLGVPAMMLALALKSSFRCHAATASSVEQLLTAMLDDITSLCTAREAVELVVGLVPTDAAGVELAVAGRALGVVVRRDGVQKVEFACVSPTDDHGGAPRKDDEGPKPGRATVRLEPGDHLLLASRRMCEVAEPAGELLGDEGLLRLAEAARADEGPLLVEGLMDRIRRFRSCSDDLSLALLCLSRVPEQGTKNPENAAGGIQDRAPPVPITSTAATTRATVADEDDSSGSRRRRRTPRRPTSPGSAS